MAQLHLIFVLVTVAMVDGKEAYVCYSRSSSPCISTTLTCKEGQVITMEGISDTNKITIGPSDKQCQSETECSNDECCRPSPNDAPITLRDDDRLQVYGQCANQQSCTVTSPYPYIPSNSGYIQYVYFCIDDPQERTISIENDYDKSIQEDTFVYLNGSSDSRKQIPRCCQFTSSEPITIITYYVNLHVETCKHVKITNGTLFSCSGDRVVVLIKKLSIEDNRIDIKDLAVQSRDIIWIKLKYVRGSQFNVSCRSCSSDETTTAVAMVDGKSTHACSSCTSTALPCKEGGDGFRIATIILSSVCFLLLMIIIIIITIYVCLHRKRKEIKEHQSKSLVTGTSSV